MKRAVAFGCARQCGARSGVHRLLAWLCLSNEFVGIDNWNRRNSAEAGCIYAGVPMHMWALPRGFLKYQV